MKHSCPRAKRQRFIKPQSLSGLYDSYLASLKLSIIRSTPPKFKLSLFWIFSILAISISWPDFSPYYEPGVDGSISWVFNYLFNSGLVLGKHVIFPHGPLAFLMYPIPFGINLELAMLFHLSLTLLLAHNVYGLIKHQRNLVLLSPVLLWLILVVVNLQLLLLAVLISVFLNNLEKEHLTAGFWIIPLVAIAIFIKSYVGILSIILLITFLTLRVFKKRSLLPILLGVGSVLLSFLTLWLVMYGGLGGLVRYFYGITQLAGDNSIAVSYYPNNNWWLLSAFLLFFFGANFFLKGRRIVYFYLLLLPLLFAGWKHGMAREDIFHAGQFFRLLLLTAGFSLLYLKGRYLIASGMMLIGSFAFFLNMINVEGFRDFNIDFWKADNLVEQFSDFHSYKQKYLKLSEQKCAVNQLDKALLDGVGESLTDTYPWDYSIIAANKLNWKPRSVLQSYASYSSWLDQQNFDHFSSEDRPEFLIWERDKLYQSRYGEEMSSIDWRYLLNDEPETLLEIFSAYSVTQISDRFVILKKSSLASDISKKSEPYAEAQWNQWIPVSEGNGAVQRLKVDIQPTVMGRLRSFAYKSGEVYIYYQLEDLSILSYKIVPNNAKDGLWVNPFISNWDSSMFPQRVVAVQFRTSDPSLLKNSIRYCFEDVFMNSPLLERWENSSISNNKRSSREQPDHVEKASVELVQQMLMPVMLGDNEFHQVWKVDLDSLLKSTSVNGIELDLEAWVKVRGYDKAIAVLVIEEKGNELVWDQRRLSDFTINDEDWNYFRSIWKVELADSYSSKQNLQLKLFIWNPKNTKVGLKQIRLRSKFQTKD